MKAWNWDRWVGNDPLGTIETAVLHIKHLQHRLGCRVDLHWIVDRDAYNCFHTHPAWALRLILEGGYVEENVKLGSRIGQSTFRTWRPGDWGIIRPRTCHRIHRLLRPGVGSYSLWVRAPITSNIKLVGYNVEGIAVGEELSHVKEE